MIDTAIMSPTTPKQPIHEHNNEPSTAATATKRTRPKKLTSNSKSGPPPSIRCTSVKSRQVLPTKPPQKTTSKDSLPAVPASPSSNSNSNSNNQLLSNAYIPSMTSPSMMLSPVDSKTGTTTPTSAKNTRPKVLRANTLRQTQQWNSVLTMNIVASSSKDSGDNNNSNSNSSRNISSSKIDDTPKKASKGTTSNKTSRALPPRTASDSNTTSFRPPPMLNGTRAAMASSSSRITKSNSSKSRLRLMQQSAAAAAATKPDTFANTVIKPTPEQHTLMRQISVLGLEDPVFDRAVKRDKDHESPQDPVVVAAAAPTIEVAVLRDLGLQDEEDVPDDMKQFFSSTQQTDALNDEPKTAASSTRSSSRRLSAPHTMAASPKSPRSHHHKRRPTRADTEQQGFNNTIPKSPHRVKREFIPSKTSRRASADMLSDTVPLNDTYANTPATPTRTTKRSGSVRRTIRTLFNNKDKKSKDKYSANDDDVDDNASAKSSSSIKKKKKKSSRRSSMGNLPYIPTAAGATTPPTTTSSSSIRLNKKNTSNTPSGALPTNAHTGRSTTTSSSKKNHPSITVKPSLVMSGSKAASSTPTASSASSRKLWQQVEYPNHQKVTKKKQWQGAPAPLRSNNNIYRSTSTGTDDQDVYHHQPAQ